MDEANPSSLYTTDIRDIIFRDWAIPSVRSSMQIYPETAPIMSEVWHGQKWHELPMGLLPPMWESSESKHFYVNELCFSETAKYYILQKCEACQTPSSATEGLSSEIFALSLLVTIDQRLIALVGESLAWVPARTLTLNHSDLRDLIKLPAAY